MKHAAAATALLLSLWPFSHAAAQSGRDCRAIAALTGADGRELRDISIRVTANAVQLFHRSSRIELPPAESCEFSQDSDFGVTLECRWRALPNGPGGTRLFDAVDGALRRCLGNRLSTPVDPPEPPRGPDEDEFDIVQRSRAEMPARYDDVIEVEVQQTQHGISMSNGARVWLSVFVPATR